MKLSKNPYALVFGTIAVLVLLFALSTLFYSTAPVRPGANSTSNLPNYGAAPDITGISNWINSAPLRMAGLRGKVVLIDFWTYSCINCIRTLPYLESWQMKYGGNGLVIIGVHTPEFQFEKNYSNVLSAVRRYNLTYPVAMDNGYSTWLAYGNRYWPADYLVDANGTIRDVHFGEGGYNATETKIRQLLEAAGYSVKANMTSLPADVNFSQIATPEIYLGYATARTQIGNPQGLPQNQTVNYTASNATKGNTVYLAGEWHVAQDGIISVSGSRLYLIYRARSVNIVASGPAAARVILDGKPLAYPGSDDVIAGGNATAYVDPPRLYNIVSAPSYGTHALEIDAGPGLKLYTFTFG